MGIPTAILLDFCTKPSASAAQLRHLCIVKGLMVTRKAAHRHYETLTGNCASNRFYPVMVPL
ncbi:MAG: hypothetical protein USCAAHI_00108 [Beijerinckiaceae bacterium]|nr:MAG: hypothetical protein USCAAHI_00108 [Beijerinckiaceae bacterium]